MRYRGREFSEEEIEIIKSIIKEAPPPKLRSPISREICRRLNWRKPDGGLKDMAARVALLQMEKDSLFVLPPARRSPNTFKQRFTELILPPIESIAGSLHDLVLEISLVPKTEASIWNAYIQQYHYLGYTKAGGAQLRYFVKSKNRFIAFFAFSAAAWKVKPRDEFMGWTLQQRENNLHLIVNNSRFLILPSVKVPHLASHLLSRITRRLPNDWMKVYNYKPILMETFVQKNKFKGTSYKAANWVYLGDTKGRGKFDTKHLNSAPIKTIWVYPLIKNIKKTIEKLPTPSTH
jgi:hypothetical protein